MWFSGRLTLCVTAYSRPHALCILPTLIIVNDLRTGLVPALQECHDVTCHWYRYLSHQADVTCRLLTLTRMCFNLVVYVSGGYVA